MNNIHISRHKAGFFLRVVGFFIDTLIIFFLHFTIITYLIRALENILEYITNMQWGIFGIFHLLGFHLSAVLYHAIMESSKYQGSLGKKMLDIKVVNYHKNRISFGQGFLRNISKFPSIWIFGLGFLMPLWTKNKQTLHDIISKCYVVEEKKIRP